MHLFFQIINSVPPPPPEITMRVLGKDSLDVEVEIKNFILAIFLNFSFLLSDIEGFLKVFLIKPFTSTVLSGSSLFIQFTRVNMYFAVTMMHGMQVKSHKNK